MMTCKFVPTSGRDFQQFLLGVWRIRRLLTFQAGGYSGHFEGDARVEVLPDKPQTLLYQENGVFSSTDGSKVIEARQQYAFDCSQWPIQVLFVDQLTTPLKLGGHFVDLCFKEDQTECEFSHLCGSDTYSGTWRVLNADAFRWSWRIEGPRKDGEISSFYSRITAGTIGGDHG